MTILRRITVDGKWGLECRTEELDALVVGGEILEWREKAKPGRVAPAPALPAIGDDPAEAARQAPCCDPPATPDPSI